MTIKTEANNMLKLKSIINKDSHKEEQQLIKRLRALDIKREIKQKKNILKISKLCKKNIGKYSIKTIYEQKANTIIVESKHTGVKHNIKLSDGFGTPSIGLSRLCKMDKQGVFDCKIYNNSMSNQPNKINELVHIIMGKDNVVYFSNDIDIINSVNNVVRDRYVFDSTCGIDMTKNIDNKEVPISLENILQYCKVFVNSNIAQQTLAFSIYESYLCVKKEFKRKIEKHITFPMMFIDVETDDNDMLNFKALLWKKKKNSRYLGARNGNLEVINMRAYNKLNQCLSAFCFPLPLFAFFVSRGFLIDFVWEDELPPYKGRIYKEDKNDDEEISYSIKSIRNVVFHSPRSILEKEALMILVDWEIPEYNEGIFSEEPNNKSYLSWISIYNLISYKCLMQYFKFRAPFIRNPINNDIYPKDFTGLINPTTTDEEDYISRFN